MVLLAGLVRSSCDVTLAALGICSSQCDSAALATGEFSLCAKKQETKTSAASSPAPMRECKYYVNGTIDVPTQTVITAWVEVGSRLCIGDKPVESKPAYRSVTEQLDDIFSAKAQPPVAYRESSENPEPFEAVHFYAESSDQRQTGSLFGEPAQIRFRPVGYRWEYSDGATGFGRSNTRSFDGEGNHSAQVFVRFEVDYETGGVWHHNAAQFTLGSNLLSIRIVDPPRRTLLVDGQG